MLFTTIDRYLTRQLAVTLFRSLVVLVLLYVLVDLLVQRAGQFSRQDAPWWVAIKYYLAMTPGIVANYVAPFAMLASFLLVLGETAQHNEFTAALASGISARRFVRGPVLLAAVFACGVWAMQETIGPLAATTALDIERNYLSRDPESERAPVSWVNLPGGWSCHVMKLNRIALSGEGVFVYRIEPKSLTLITARRIYWSADDNVWLLERGWWEVYDPVSNTRVEYSRISQRAAPFTQTPAELFALEASPETKSTRRLAEDITDAQARKLPVERALMDYHVKFAQPALSFVMAWLAIPFALRLRRGGLAISFGASVAIAICYLVLFFISVGMGQMGRIPPALAAWLANLVFLAAGLVLSWRSPT